MLVHAIMLLFGKHEVEKKLYFVHFKIGKSFYLYSKVTSFKNFLKVTALNMFDYVYRICTLISQKQQNVILLNMNENQNPWHMHVFNIHTYIRDRH